MSKKYSPFGRGFFYAGFDFLDIYARIYGRGGMKK
jgi:hypothetical protein